MKWDTVYPVHIFVTNITNYICGEKIVMWGYFEKKWEFFRDFATIYALSCLGTLSPKSIFVEKKMTNMRSASESERPLIDSGVTR